MTQVSPEPAKIFSLVLLFVHWQDPERTKIYFNKNYDQLHAEIMKLEMFGETEAQNL